MIGKFFRKLLVFALIVGLGFACFALYRSRKEIVRKKDEQIAEMQAKTNQMFREAYTTLIEELHTPTANGDRIRAENNGVMQKLFSSSSFFREDGSLKTVLLKLDEAAKDPSVLMMNDANYQLFVDLEKSDFRETDAKSIVEKFPAIAK